MLLGFEVSASEVLGAVGGASLDFSCKTSRF
jgi:hypothetical protein